MKQHHESIKLCNAIGIASKLTRAEVDTNKERDRRNKGRTELQPPCDGANLIQDQIGAHAPIVYSWVNIINHWSDVVINSQEDTKCCPELPAHDQTTTNCRRYVLSRKDGYR
jgi:hypothetical protein